MSPCTSFVLRSRIVPSSSVGISKRHLSRRLLMMSTLLPDFDLNKSARSLNLYYREACLHNRGRSLAEALGDFVEECVDVFIYGGCSPVQLQLETQVEGEIHCERNPLERLTQDDKEARARWIRCVWLTLRTLGVVSVRRDSEVEGPSTSAADAALQGLVSTTVKGQQTGDRQSYVPFDRSLATRGNQGGVATENVAVPPQVIPLSQLVLLTMKAVNERGLLDT
ncbi:unnamed protein product [Vitrella brassicaformis CCMP3155]|uniref:Uncharacterized protein n=2 Tax=Vitrella brassicaformis TaxID=1169539 RepID=A0A0G4F2M6_VITBC|nr:unnamed protein product [Vitrella brassicaformis CCMP3155]|eukprot:CEM06463.1 unnamed protein product [Vitrella brassicaformis CCMP3155]